MFAVKGWSVDAASLKPQTEIFKSSKSGDNEPGKSRKRKRKHGSEAKQDSSTRSGDVGRPAGQHGEDTKLQKQQKDKDHKSPKGEQTRGAGIASSKQPHPASKPKALKEIERWEDIDLGTKSDKPKKKKRKTKLLSFTNGVEKNEQTQQDQEKHASPSNIEGSEVSRKAKPTPANGTHHQQKDTVPQNPALPQPTSLTPMQSAMRQKLISARFRHLNQTLCTEPSTKAKDLFTQNPEMFEDYHAGFRQQVSVWPENPLDKFIIAIRQRGKIKPIPQVKPKRRKANSKIIVAPKDPGHALPRTNGTSVIADLGCGDARLAYTLTVSGDTTTLNLKLHSFDLHGTSPYVTRADIANLPLKDDSVDVAILCLSLMGTNWISFIEEAHRILHWKGELWVAEIKSRFGRVGKAGQPVDHSVGSKRKQAAARKAQEAKAKEQNELAEEEVLQTEVDGVPNDKEETDVSAFVQVLKRRGFIVKPPSEKHIDLHNKMFVKMEFVKALTPIKGKGKQDTNAKAGSESKLKFFSDDDANADSEDEAKVLKPCLYKIR